MLVGPSWTDVCCLMSHGPWVAGGWWLCCLLRLGIRLINRGVRVFWGRMGDGNGNGCALRVGVGDGSASCGSAWGLAWRTADWGLVTRHSPKTQMDVADEESEEARAQSR